jgi:NADPH:quinone reductase-like Zn-dependent oxidoreductase
VLCSSLQTGPPQGGYPWAIRDGVVPGSDGAGEVLAVGSKVTRFREGDGVVTLFNQGHLSGSLNKKTILTGLGGMVDGPQRQYGVFSEEGLVEMPPSLSWLEASILSCAVLTSWNALYGLKGYLSKMIILWIFAYCNISTLPFKK